MMHKRTIELLGATGHRRLQSSFVVVVGLGGVGSHAVAALARAGVGRFRIVDSDTVSPSSLNRHAVAVRADIGRLKTDVTAEWLHRLDPSISVEALPMFAAEETADTILAGDPTLIVDAIDSLVPKTDLLAACVDRGLPVISCMGAASRLDPTAIRVGDIGETTVCPLARRVRRFLKRRGVRDGITVVYSTEKPRPPLPPDEDEPTLARGRVRNRQPSLSTLPGIFGLVVANAAVLTIAGPPEIVGARTP